MFRSVETGLRLDENSIEGGGVVAGMPMIEMSIPPQMTNLNEVAAIEGATGVLEGVI